MKLLMTTLSLTFILLSACKSHTPSEQQVNTLGATVHTEKVKQELMFRRILKDFEDNKIDETESNEAYLIGKSYEADNKLDYAEKLFEISYKFLPTVTVAIDLVQVKIALKKTSEAKDIAKHAYVIFPNNSNILLTLIQIYQIENNLVQVANLLDKAHSKFPKNESIAILYASYNKKDSKKILKDFVTQNPDSANALLKLSHLFYKEKKYDEALKYAQKSYAYDPDNIETIVTIAKVEENRKNYPIAERFYKIAFEKDFENNINAQNYINILLFQKKQQEALSNLLKLEASSDTNVPFPPEFIYEIGRISLINHDYNSAKKRFESLLDPQYASLINQNDVLFFLAYSCENLHLFSEALNYLGKIDPTSAIYTNAEKEKILVHINSNQKEIAEGLLKNFKISQKTYYEDTLFKSSVLLFFNKYDEAVELLNQAINIKPNEKELYLKRVDAYINANKSMETILAEAKSIVKKWPSYADGLNLLGYLLIDNSKNLNYSEKLLKKALSFETKNPYYLDSLGCLYLKKNNLALSQKYFIESLKYTPNEPVILFHYAKVLKLLHEEQEATKTLEKARTIISNMLIYTVNSDYELKSIAAILNRAK